MNATHRVWVLVIFIIAVLLLVLSATGCGTAGKVYRVFDPRDVNKQELAQTPPTAISQKYKFKIVLAYGVDQSKMWWGNYIDQEWEEYTSAMQKYYPDFNVKFSKLQSIKIIVVEDSKFECKYHKGRCSGEYDSSLKAIFVARKDFDKDGFVPLLKHEWSHANGLLKSNHSNHSEVKRVTRY